MAKKAKQVKSALVTPAVQPTAPVAPAAPVVVPNATRRTPLAQNTLLVLGPKPGQGRVGHTAAAWSAVQAAIVGSKGKGVAMTELAKLITDEIRAGHPGNGSAMSYLTYWHRRGYLKVAE